MSYFCISFLPNNLFMIYFGLYNIEHDSSQNISSNRDINNNNYTVYIFLSFFLFLISFCGSFTLIMKLTDPYIWKYFRNYFRPRKILMKKNSRQIENLGDLRDFIDFEDNLNDETNNLDTFLIDHQKRNNDFGYANIYSQTKNSENKSYLNSRKISEFRSIEESEEDDLKDKKTSRKSSKNKTSIIKMPVRRLETITKDNFSSTINSDNSIQIHNNFHDKTENKRLEIESKNIPMVTITSPSDNTPSRNNLIPSKSFIIRSPLTKQLSSSSINDLDKNNFHLSIPLNRPNIKSSNSSLLRNSSSLYGSTAASKFISKATNETSLSGSPGNLDHKRKINKLSSILILSEGFHTFDLMNSHLEFSDNLYRMIGISIAINEDKIYDREIFYLSKFASSLPWENKLYQEKSVFQEYTQSNLPDWVNIKYDKRFKAIKIKIRKYVPLVFHHIRIIDKVQVEDCIKALDPILNLQKINELKVQGGRSDNCILYTWDHSLLVKTISKQEKNLLIQMIKDYQIRMRDTKTLLCRIYGLFRIKVSDQFESYVVLMKNMNELPLSRKYLSFDIKGSSVNRDTILDIDKKIYNQGHKETVIGRYQNKTLKDNDLTFLSLKFNLNSTDARNLILSVENDADFLAKYYVTDYSLFVNINKFNKDDYRASFRNTRIMKSTEDEYLFNFSIIDFLTVIIFLFYVFIIIFFQ